MKIVLGWLKNLISKMHITVFAMIMVLMPQNMNEDWFYMAESANFGDVERLHKGHHQINLQNG